MAIVEKYQNIKGWWIVRNTINTDRAIFLKFDHDPTQAEVDIVTTKLLNDEIIEAAKTKRVARIEEFLDILHNHMIEYMEANPTATKAQILLEMRNYIQSGAI
jgi:hypothetical protein